MLIENLEEEDHPRVCGKHSITIKTIRCNTRITPAYAGNTCFQVVQIEGSKDHPRVCGKHKGSNLRRAWLEGSPPRMRETLTLIIRKNICYRITPAYAGNTIPACRRFPFGQDHPRVCGKHRTKSLSYSPAAGSPPRMRETQLQTAEKAPMTGITPAYAGNT